MERYGNGTPVSPHILAAANAVTFHSRHRGPRVPSGASSANVSSTTGTWAPNRKHVAADGSRRSRLADQQDRLDHASGV